MLCLLVSPVIFWKTMRSGKLLYGFPCNMSQKLWKKNTDQAILQFASGAAEMRKGAHRLFILTLGW